MNLASFTGPQAFGKAYRQMLDNDAHAPGSVDREIASSMVRLREETASHLYDAYTDLHMGMSRDLAQASRASSPGLSRHPMILNGRFPPSPGSPPVWQRRGPADCPR